MAHTERNIPATSYIPAGVIEISAKNYDDLVKGCEEVIARETRNGRKAMWFRSGSGAALTPADAVNAPVWMAGPLHIASLRITTA